MKKKVPICYLNKDAAEKIDYSKPIIVKFAKDYNINHLDFLILNKFDTYKKEIPKLKEKIKDISNKIKYDSSLNIHTRYNRKKISKYKNKIKQIEKEKEKKKYVELTRELLNLYNNIEESSKINIINDYLLIASRYINLIIYKNEEINNHCFNCGQEIIFLGNSEDTQHCSNCKFELPNTGNIKAYIRMSSGEEVKPININNFIKIVIAFKGEDGFILDKADIKLLDKYFISRGIKDLSKIKSGRTKNNSIPMMRKALGEIGRSKYYKNIYSICHQYFKWERNNISDIESKILILYEKIQLWFKNNPSRERDSSLNNQWLLYKLCEYLAPSRFNKTDFMIISSEKSLIFHAERWKQMKENSDIFGA